MNDKDKAAFEIAYKKYAVKMAHAKLSVSWSDFLEGFEKAIAHRDAQVAGLVEALVKNTRAFRHIESGEIRYALLNVTDEGEWEEVMIIPNISNAAIDAAMEAIK